MKNIYRFSVLFLLASCISLSARDWRVLQIPNGSKFSCANCHNDPNGGGARNKFGQEVEKRVSVGGNEQFWSAALAALDSDTDGKSNGTELGDPNGAWRPGQANPGNLSLVTNPGNSSSVSIEFMEPGIPFNYKLYSNYPNPFNPATTINYYLPKASKVSIYVYDLLGRIVARLVDNDTKPAGLNKIAFNGEALTSGTYIYRMETPEFAETKKMILLK